MARTGHRNGRRRAAVRRRSNRTAACCAQIIAKCAVALGVGEMGASLEDGSLPRGSLPEAQRLLGNLEVVSSPVEVADVGAGDDGGNRQHDVAERAEVFGSKRRLGPVDHRTGRIAVRPRRGSSSRRSAAAGAGISPTSGPAAVPAATGGVTSPGIAFGQVDLGKTLQGVCLARRGADVVVQVHRLLQLVLRGRQIAGQECCLTGEGAGERDRPQYARAPGACRAGRGRAR